MHLLVYLFSISLVLSAVLIGWNVAVADTTMIQIGALVTTFLGWGAHEVDGLPRGGTLGTLAFFLAGAAMGACAYHGDVSILIAILWVGLFFWIKRTIRQEVADAFDVLKDLLD